MTIFGVDLSKYQAGFNFPLARSQGVEFAIIQTNDGWVRQLPYREMVDQARAAGMIVAAYIFLRPGSSDLIRQHVNVALEQMGDRWRLPVWIDVETRVSKSNILDAIRFFEDAGIRVLGCYSNRPDWERGVVDGEPMGDDYRLHWTAGYPLLRGGEIRQLYIDSGGDAAQAWRYPLGNRLPVIWQFTNQAHAGGMVLDGNAFRGTRDELEALFYGKTERVKDTSKKEGGQMDNDKLDLILDQLAGPARDEHGNHTFAGWDQLGGKTLVDAVAGLVKSVEELKKELAK